MSGYQFDRECRTAQSESYIIELDDDEIGRIDIHYSPSVAYGTLCVAESLTEEDTRGLISEIDERLVLTTDPFREDFVVTVWAGREAAVYSDEDFEGEDDEDDEDEDEEMEGNGHRRG
ncbi:MAG: hypothetical protein Q7T33_03740 [Dehalococcoidia bacterium]|nr:hypothetical protein [Dehalococcoidia bacterium]